MGTLDDLKAAVPESIFYARHFRLPGFTTATQDRLRKSRVLIVGAGGLGCPAALYLAGAGVGTLALCDGDVVSATNLHRQVLFTAVDVGRPKVDVAAERLLATNPHIAVERLSCFADSELLDKLVPQYDLVLDGTDNFEAKYLLNDACERHGVALVYGSIFQFEGQVSVFHVPTSRHPKGLSYRDLYPDMPPEGLSQNCGEAGVVGVLPGVIGTLQANEAIKVLAGLGEPLAGGLLVFDALTASMRRLVLDKRVTDKSVVAVEGNEHISADELEALLASANRVCLVDVREASERAVNSLGGLHIPLTSLPRNISALRDAQTVIVYCKSGVRSAKAALYLRSVLPETRVLSLRGGIDGAMCLLSQR